MRSEISDDEKKNGWTEATLKAYIEQREAAQAAAIFPSKPAIIVQGLSTYDPKKDF